ncbi:MAG: Hsp70 family protein, partial [Proteobacteria bacterium]
LTFAIDYGTSNSLLVATDGESVTAPLDLDPSALDPTVLRSILYFPNSKLCYYGQNAINQYNENSGEGRLIRSIKKYLPSESYVGSYIEDRVVRLEDLIGFFLLEIKKRGEAQVGRPVDRVVLGRPAKFSADPAKDQLAQYRLEKAAELAGFKQIAFLPEPLAAALDLRTRLETSKTVLVVDLGGGTSDFTVIRIGPGEFRDEDVLGIGGVSVAGDAVDGEFMKNQVAPFLGSKVKYKVPMGSNVLEMPKSLLDHICSPADLAQLRRSDHLDFFRSVQKWTLKESDKEALERLFVLVEDQLGFAIFEEIDRLKRALGESDEAKFNFDAVGAEIEFPLSRPDFDVSVTRPVEQILESMDATLRASELTPEQIDVVYCTGGTSKLALVQKALRRRFPDDKIVKQDYFHSVIQGLGEFASSL